MIIFDLVVNLMGLKHGEQSLFLPLCPEDLHLVKSRAENWLVGEGKPRATLKDLLY